MKPGTHAQLLFMAMLAAIVIQAGCAPKSGIARSEKVTASMQTVQNDMNQASAQIDATNAALNTVVTTGQAPTADAAEVKKAFEDYSDNVNKMEKTANAVNKHIDQMNSQGNEYFEEWSKQAGAFTDPKMHRLSEQERARLSDSFSNITASSSGVRGSLNGYVAQLKQLETFLSNNLTAQGLSQISQIAQAAEQDGRSLKQAFQPVQSAIEQARTEMTPGGAAAGGGPGNSQQQQQQQQQQNQPDQQSQKLPMTTEPRPAGQQGQ